MDDSLEEGESTPDIKHVSYSKHVKNKKLHK